MSRSRLSLLLLILPGFFLQAAGAKMHSLLLFAAGTAMQGVGLVPWLRVKGRSPSFALLALAPVFGWIVAVNLRSEEQREEIALARESRGPGFWVKRTAVVVAGLLLVGTCSFLQAALFDVHREGYKLVQALERHKESHGIYPPRLEELGIPVKYPREGWRGTRYRTDAGGQEFFLTCFVRRLGTTDERVTYNSRKDRWRSYR